MKVVDFYIHVELDDDGKAATVAIGCEPGPPPPAAMLAAVENFMNLWAMQGADYENSLKLLCDGARTCKLILFEGKKVQ